MAIRSATSEALLVANSVVLSFSGCGTRQTQTFPSIQNNRIETTTFSPVIEAISRLESNSNLAVKPQINGIMVQILATNR